MITTTSQVLQSDNLKLLSTLFFNLGNEEGNFYYIDSTYKKSKYSNMQFTEELARKNNDLLTDYTNLNFEIKTVSETTITHRAKIKITNNDSRAIFLNKIYSKIEQQRYSTLSNVEFNRIIILSFFVLRGSADFVRNYFTVDILGKNITEEYINNLINILSATPYFNQLNFNFRELQPQFYNSNIKRNTQLRINLKWFYDNYIEYIIMLNLYKYDLLNSNFTKFELKNYAENLSRGFFERAYFYKQKILGNLNNLTNSSDKAIDFEIQLLRDELKFNKENDENTTTRNSFTVQYAKLEQEDICYSCNNIYKLLDRTFTYRNTNKPYLEMHHVLSFGSNSKYDVKDNLVNLCPACHKALTPNRADEHYQKTIIKNILNNSQTAKNYVSQFITDGSPDTVYVDFVYSKLK